MSTRAVKFLNQKGIPFEIIKYPHEEKGAEFAARAVGCFVLMPGDKQVALKRLAKAFSVKRAAMIDTETAERLTGYQVGGISPFGSKQRLPTIMEKSLMVFEKVLINAGQRGIMLMMNPGDIVDVLYCKITELTQK